MLSMMMYALVKSVSEVFVNDTLHAAYPYQNNTSSTTAANTTPYDRSCPHGQMDLRTILFVVLLVCVFIVGLISNCLAVIVIMLSKKLRKHPTNLLVASLNVCDIGVLLFSVPLNIDGIVHKNNFCHSLATCYFYNVTDLALHISSISHLFVIAIERFIAVKTPFYHRQRVTKSVTKNAITTTWIYSIVWTVLGFFSWTQPSLPTTSVISTPKATRVCSLHNPTYFVAVNVCVYIVPLALMAIMYWSILRTAFYHQRKASNCSQSSLKKNHRRKKEAEISKTVAIIYGAFVFCWLPVTIITIILQRCPDCFVDFVVSYPKASDAIFTTLILVLPAVHSCLNPFIYIIFHDKFADEIRDLFNKRTQRLESVLIKRKMRKSSKNSILKETQEL